MHIYIYIYNHEINNSSSILMQLSIADRAHGSLIESTKTGAADQKSQRLNGSDHVSLQLSSRALNFRNIRPDCWAQVRGEMALVGLLVYATQTTLAPQ